MSQDTIRVLLIEDNPGDIRLVSEVLKTASGVRYELVEAHKLNGGLERLADGGADVVLLDLDLPDSRGLATFEKTHTRAPDVPIVVLSGLDDEDLATDAVRAGAQDYLVKGLHEYDMLSRVLLHAIERKRRQEELLRIRSAVDAANDAVLITDRAGGAVFVNRSFVELFGLTPREVNEAGIDALCGQPDVASQVLSALDQAANWHGEGTMLSADGRRFPASIRATAVRSEDSALVGMLFTVSDATERKKAEDDLRRSEEKYRRLVENADIGISTVDQNGTILQVNATAAARFGLDVGQVIGKKLSSVLGERGAADQMSDIARVIETQQGVAREVATEVQGEERWYVVNVQPAAQPDGSMAGVHVFSRDITEQKRTEERLLYEATHDPLTGLFNRRYFMERLQGGIRSAKRYNYPLALCVCDLDNFKMINDVHGHLTGDEVLSQFGKAISNELRGDDIAGRYGGDEFWIILPHTPASEAVTSIQRIATRVEKLVFRGRDRELFSVSATFGIADLVSREMTEQELLVAADQSLYRGKEAGGNRIVVHEP